MSTTTMEQQAATALKSNLYQLSRYPSSPLPKFLVGPHYTMKALGKRPSTGFLRVRAEGQGESGPVPFMLQTTVFELPNGPLKHEDGSVSFGIRNEQCPNLQEIMTNVEKTITETLLQEAESIENLPEKVAQEWKNHKGPLIRPMVSDKARIFLQPSNDCRTYDWLGSNILENEWNAGKYQMIIRLSSIFLGQKGHAYPIYLQWKICQIRYFPQPVQRAPLAFLFNMDEMASASADTTITLEEIFGDDYEPFALPLEKGGKALNETPPSKRKKTNKV